MRAVALVLLGLMILRCLYAALIGVRDGILRQRIEYWNPRRSKLLTGQKAVVYGWYSLLAGSLLAALCAWAVAAVLASDP